MVKSAYRVTQILEAVALSRGGLRHAEIAQILKIPKGSLSLLLADLVAQEYLSLKGDGKRYLLGPQVLVLAGHYIAGIDLVQIGRPIVTELVVRTGESAEVAMRKGDEVIIVCREVSSRSLSSCMQIGDRAPLYATASGKAILAHLFPEEIDAYLSSGQFRSLTKKTVTDPGALRGELEAIRTGAVAYSREEHSEGIVAMALAVFGFDGQVAGSIVVPMPSIRFNRQKELGLRDLSLRMSRQLGFTEKVDKKGKGKNGKGPDPSGPRTDQR
jgi:DNA-binding IclR family transcriptional regulator